ncbi:MAG: glycosyltransferase family 4 protein [Actinomycetes bacterium]|jgi:phosphatidyl-myo-inositol alpha-mannosyltransferase
MNRKLRIGMVCPYGWDTPGGVQIHMKELAEHFQREGHIVSLLAPVSDESSVIEDWVVPAGRPVPIPFNGAVARILFGPIATSRVRQWISTGEFDLIHLHEPAIPSLSLLACVAAEGPMVATFHASAPKQKAIYAIGPILEPILEKLSARIAVSEMARETLKVHFQTEAVVIPNGIDAGKYSRGERNSDWYRPHTIGFLGRFDEPRKGLSVLLSALPEIARSIPDVQLLVAGPGDEEQVMKNVDSTIRSRIRFLGRLSEEEKSDFFKSVDLYVAPNIHGESFGIILAEAMAGGSAVVASDIQAFTDLLQNGDFGATFKNESSKDLASVAIRLLKDDEERKALAARALEYSKIFDWGTVAAQILDVYEVAIASGVPVTLASENRGWKRLRSE